MYAWKYAKQGTKVLLQVHGWNDEDSLRARKCVRRLHQVGESIGQTARNTPLRLPHSAFTHSHLKKSNLHLCSKIDPALQKNAPSAHSNYHNHHTHSTNLEIITRWIMRWMKQSCEPNAIQYIEWEIYATHCTRAGHGNNGKTYIYFYQTSHLRWRCHLG